MENSDAVFGLFMMGWLSGVFPIAILLFLFTVLIFLWHGMGKAMKVLGEKEAPPKVQRNIRQELWDERDEDALSQTLRDIKERREHHGSP